MNALIKQICPELLMYLEVDTRILKSNSYLKSLQVQNECREAKSISSGG